MKYISKKTIALAIICVVFSTLTSLGQDVKPFKAEEVKPFKAEEVKPFKAEEVKPVKASVVKPVKTSEIKPYKAAESRSQTKEKVIGVADNKADLSYFSATYQYWVPGTSYTVADYTNNQLVLHNSAGTGVLPGSLKIDANGTYIWNSSWDGKIIKGNWRATGDAEYPIELLKAQEGRNWKIGKSNEKDVAILIWNGSTWYNGKKVNRK